MRLIGKLLALPFMLVTGILYLVCKFLVVLSGAVLGILSGIIFLAALVLFFVAGFLPGLAWLMIAFLISPYGLPLAAAWLVGIIGGANSALIAEWNDKLTDVLENRSERNRWINHFMKFSTMEDIDRRAVMQLIRSIRVMGKDELHIEFNYQDEYQKAISLAEQIATKNEERMVG